MSDSEETRITRLETQISIELGHINNALKELLSRDDKYRARQERVEIELGKLNNNWKWAIGIATAASSVVFAILESFFRAK